MNELTYTRCGDYYIPDLKLSETEELKARDPMRWVGLMNTLKAQVEEIMQSELIFQ